MSGTRPAKSRAHESAKQSLREVDERFRLLAESVEDYAIFILDELGFVMTWNPGAERIKGYRADEIIGQHFSRFYPEEDVRSGKCDRELRAAAETGRYEDEGWRVRQDGSRFWANAIVTSLRDSRGNVIGFAKVTRDLTERRAAEEARLRLAQTTAAREEAERALAQLTRLQRLSGALGATRTPQELSTVVIERGVEALHASAGSFVRVSGEELVLATTTAAEDTEITSEELFMLASRAARERAVFWHESPEDFARVSIDVRATKKAAACALPLMIGPRVLGAISFGFTQERSFTPFERAFMETFATQVAQALDRTEGHLRETEGRRRLETLSALADALSSAVTTNDVADVIVEVGLDATLGDLSLLYVFDERTRSLSLIAERGCSPSSLERTAAIDADSQSTIYAAFLAGTGIWIQDDEECLPPFPTLAGGGGSSIQSFWSLPLVAEGKPIGLVCVGFRTPRVFSPEERDFVETFARHCGEALLRARRLEAERAARTVAESLQASLATTLRSIGDAVIATDARGRVTILNPVAEELTGWPEEEARGRPLHEIFTILYGQSREPLPSTVDQVLESDAVVEFGSQMLLVHRNGRRETPIDYSGAPIRGPAGSLDGVVLVLRDVTVKKREEALRNLLVEATTALAESLDYEATLSKVAQLAVPRLADWCVVAVVEEGRQETKQVAVAHVDPTKVHLTRALSENYALDPKAPGSLVNVLRTGRSELYSEATRSAFEQKNEGDRLHLSANLGLRSAMLVPLVARGRTLGAMTFAWSESDRYYTRDDLDFAEELAHRCALAIDNARLYAAEQRARQGADIANRAKDEFLAMVSHELRTPLNAIMGWAKMLSSSALDEPKRMRAVETIDRNAVAMAQLIEDLLDISRIISGKMRLEVQLVDLTRVVEAAIESVKPAAYAKEIRIVATLDTTVGSFIGDPTRLQQVVWNLLSNAVKFTPKSGRIDVIVRRDGSNLEISVTDTGKGIDPRFLPHVFDPFRQEDASHTRSRGGLGIGLAIARQLVELHGGRIEALSDGEGLGATFIVYLPVSAVSRLPDQRPAGPRQIRLDSTFERPSQLQGIRVLIVDDEEDARQLVKSVLEECGCHVTTAANVTDAMELISRDVPDLLISDIGMPNQDGYDLIRQVRALPVVSGGNIPAAALTAYARAEDRRRVLDAGYSMHIPKPVEPAELVAVVASLTRFIYRSADAGP